jgi:hypothetical protein
MTMRAGWTFDGKHFCETWTTRRGAPCLMYFVDGKVTARKVFLQIMAEAKAAEAAKVA